MSTPNVTKACLKKMKNGQPSGDPIPIHFNPSTLQYTIENTLSDQGQGGGSGGGGGQGGSGGAQGNKKTQYVSQSTGKLSMDLIYDTTDSGDDVRLHTQKVGKLMQPDAGSDKVPPVVQFEWGMYTFKGMLQQYQETIEFFSSDGVPLRATVKITITSQSDVFDEIDPSKAKQASVVPTSVFDSATSAATLGGDPNAGRALASANQLDSMRFTGGSPLTLDTSVQLKPPVGFAPAGGAGAGLSLGGGGSLGGGLSIGGGISAGIGFGGSSSAGVSATEGAFAGLRAKAQMSVQTNLDPARMQRVTSTTDFTTDSSATFNLGGQASMKSSTGLSAEVGTSRSLRDVIKFED
jgi:contractile injection system tube protein